MKTKLQLKRDWKKYLLENPKWGKTINNHHYFRTRYASKFWLKEIEYINNLLENKSHGGGGGAGGNGNDE